MEEKKKPGRPPKYKSSNVEIARKLCEAGAIDVEIARHFQVSVSTLSTWKLKYPEFLAAIRVSKEVANTNVEDSLYRMAMGYTRTEVEHKVVAGKLVTIEVERYYPPNPTSQIFFLKNRKSGSWSDKQEVQHTGTVELTDRIHRARANAAPKED